MLKKYHVMHPLEDKRTAEQARMISLTLQPIWLLDSDPQSTFDDAEAAAAAALATAAAPTATPATPSSPSIPEQPL